MRNLHKKIVEIGNELVKCPEQCEGIVNSPLDFIPPRCLYLEPRDANAIDCVVIGMNPGKIDEKNKETKYYKKNDLDYSVLYDFWYDYRSGRPDAKNNGHAYNRLIRTFLKEANLIPNEAILWTELCKCQSSLGEPPLQTYRTCMSKYLNKELNLVKKDTPLICAGYTAYRAMAFIYTDKSVIGIPHPSARGNILRTLTNDASAMQKAQEVILYAIKFNKAVWISNKKSNTNQFLT